MPAASLPTLDWELVNAMGVSPARDKRDALALNSGFMRAQVKSHGAKGKRWDKSNLPAWQVGINFYNETGITSFLTGYEQFDPTEQWPERGAFYQPQLSGLLMKIGAQETMVIGQDTAAMASATQARMVSCMGFLHRQYTRQIVAGGGTGFSQWGTLNGIDYTGANGGVFESSAVGSQSNTIGGLSKSTYNFAIGWQNVVVDMNNAFGTNSWRLNQAQRLVDKHKPDNGKRCWLMSINGATFGDRTFNTQVMYVNGDNKNVSNMIAKWGGLDVYPEPQMPVSTATGGSATNTTPITGYLLDNEDIFVAFMDKVNTQGVSMPDGYFGVGEWKQITGNSYVFGCPIMVAGNLVVENMGSSAVAVKGETY
jgi:hypothetical protein